MTYRLSASKMLEFYYYLYVATLFKDWRGSDDVDSSIIVFFTPIIVVGGQTTFRRKQTHSLP